MSKEGWCVALGQEGLREGGGNCLKHLKSWWEKKEGRQNKDFRKGVASWVKGGGEGAGTPLRTMHICADITQLSWNAQITRNIVLNDLKSCCWYRCSCKFTWHKLLF